VTQTLPNDPNAERAVLCAAFVRPDILGWLEVGEACFFDPRHRAVWSAMAGLHRDGIVVDDLTVTAALERVGKLEAVGGEPFLGEILTAGGTAENVEHYADILHERRVRRELVLLTAELRQRAYQGHEEGEELLSDLLRKAGEIDTGRSHEDPTMGAAVAAEYRDALDHDDGHGRHVGVPTGIDRLDRATRGIPVGIPSVLAARPSVGKSSVALAIADHASAAGHGVHVLTWEDRRSGWAQRMLGRHSGVDIASIRARELDRFQLAELGEATNRLAGRDNLAIDHAHGWTAMRAVRRARAMRRRIGTALVVVDYLQLVAADRRGGGRRQRRDQEIEDAMHAFAELAYQDNLAVLVLSQLNRDIERSEKPRRPRLSDLRESGAIEQEGKLIMALWVPPVPPEREIDHAPQVGGGDLDAGCTEHLRLEVLKNHQGLGRACVDLQFDKARCRIE
jgi:replicative DNA helicase